jgi:hypothetical protein
MINITKCFKCKKTVCSTPIKDLCEFFWFDGLCLCESCVEEIIDEWFEMYDPPNDKA